VRFIIIVFLLCISFTLNNYKLPEDTSLTLNNVWKEINKAGILFPHIVYHQCLLETGNIKYVKNNNLFGFRGTKYLVFSNWQESVKFYRRWQIKYYRGGDYYQFLLDIGYASDEKYIFKLKHTGGILTLKVKALNKLTAIKYVLNLNNNLFTILSIEKLN